MLEAIPAVLAKFWWETWYLKNPHRGLVKRSLEQEDPKFKGRLRKWVCLFWNKTELWWWLGRLSCPGGMRSWIQFQNTLPPREIVISFLFIFETEYHHCFALTGLELAVAVRVWPWTNKQPPGPAPPALGLKPGAITCGTKSSFKNSFVTQFSSSDLCMWLPLLFSEHCSTLCKSVTSWNLMVLGGSVFCD